MKKTVLIHAGMHRCASTAVQALLKRNRAGIEAGGTKLLVRTDLKGTAFGRELGLLYRHRRRSPAPWMRLRSVTRTLEDMPEGSILISEENLVGTMPGVIGPGFYPHLDGFAAAMAALGRRVDLQLRFIVRRQDQLLESAYAFRLMRGETRSLPEFLTDVGRGGLSWLPLLRALERHGLMARTRIVPLERLVGEPDAPKRVMALMGQETLMLDAGERLSGNRRVPAGGLALVLAMNRLGLGIDAAWRRKVLKPLLQGADDAFGALGESGLALTAHQMQQLRDAVAIAPVVALDDARRGELLAACQADNEEFLRHCDGGVTAGLWHQGAGQ